MPFEDTDELVVESQIKMRRDDPDFIEVDKQLSSLLSQYTLGPLLDQYERTIAQLQKDLT